MIIECYEYVMYIVSEVIGELKFYLFFMSVIVSLLLMGIVLGVFKFRVI